MGRRRRGVRRGWAERVQGLIVGIHLSEGGLGEEKQGEKSAHVGATLGGVGASLNSPLVKKPQHRRRPASVSAAGMAWERLAGCAVRVCAGERKRAARL
jgi:hypothetical protein